MSKNNFFKRFIILNSREESGKSTISQYILPSFFKDSEDESNLKLYQLHKDKSEFYFGEKMSYKSGLFKYDELQDIIVNELFTEEEKAIYDISSGIDTYDILNMMLNILMIEKNTLFIFPFLLSQKSFDGAYECLEIVMSMYPEASILFVVNNLKHDYKNNFYLSEDQIKVRILQNNINLYELDIDKLNLTYIPSFSENLAKKLLNLGSSSLDIYYDIIKNNKLGSDFFLHQEKETSLVKYEFKKKMCKKDVNEYLFKYDLLDVIEGTKPFFDKVSFLQNNLNNSDLE